MAAPGDALLASLRDAFSSKGSLLVAFSGGVDSAVVAKLSHEMLGRRALAVTADSESLPRRELDAARRLAREVGIRHEVVGYSELANASYAANPLNRCYYCRQDLASVLVPLARERGMHAVADGINADDLGDHRPGIRAMDEARVWHPLAEAGLSKEEVRHLARRLGLSVWDKPSNACLSSRVAYGVPITVERLRRVEEAEAFLHNRGFAQVRVRIEAAGARIEVTSDEVARLLEEDTAAAVAARLRSLGFARVAVDLDGYRTGSMHRPGERRVAVLP